MKKYIKATMGPENLKNSEDTSRKKMKYTSSV